MAAKEIVEILLLNDGDLRITQSYDPHDQIWTVEFEMSDGIITKSAHSLDECIDFCYQTYEKDQTRKNNHETN